MSNQSFPYLGFGLGLRPEHYEHICQHWPDVDWFEIITENYLISGGQPLYYLHKIRERYPVVMHGVSLSIGSTDPLDWDYLAQVKKLAQDIEPVWISDHLCWTGVSGKNMHDLLPLPYTQESLKHVVSRIKQVQDYLERKILLENVSSYISYKDSELTEWEYLQAVSEQADCHLLLDINNIYVSAFNHQFEAQTYIEGIAKDRVKQFHLAGHSHKSTHIVDTHDESIIEQVWQLYRFALQYFGPISTMIERDDNIPKFDELYQELMQAKEIALEFSKTPIG